MGCVQTKGDVVAALRSANAEQVKAAAEIMANQCEHAVNPGSDWVRNAYANAGAVVALVAAMATHEAHLGAQEQLCRAIKEQAMLDVDNQVWGPLLHSLV
jgi:hypothetical protein